MDKLTLDNITTEDLKDRINNLRDVLNEICCTDLGNQVEEEKLDISRQLDLLIVDYMNKIL
ncbi:MAG: Spo0E family sporulation regulatory protein-aspartic acid phosphatase [Clostridium sp.]